MKFSDLLNEYISELGCSAKDLAEKSGLSASVISRYRAGERVPFTESEQLTRLAEGLAQIALENGFKKHSKEEYLTSFASTLSQYKIDFDQFITKLNTIIDALGINLTELSKSMNFDVSFISKIRTGQRRPANIEKFVDNICSYICFHYTSSSHKIILSEILSCPEVHLTTDFCFNTLKNWFSSKDEDNSAALLEMLCNYDEFDVEEYIQDFNRTDFELPSDKNGELISKNYYGQQNMWRAFQRFFQMTLAADNVDALYLSADFPFTKVADETMGPGTFLSLLLSCISKGIKVYILHDLNKPERMVTSNIKVWIPLYMTGKIYPYYLKTPTNDVYKNVVCISDVAALRGECIGNDLNVGKIYLTNYPEEIDYYKCQADAVLRKAYPLMEVYGENQKNLFLAMLESDAMTDGSRSNILPSLPIYTMPDHLMEKILIRNGVSEKDRAYLLERTKKHSNIFNKIVESNLQTDIIYVPKESDFEKDPPAVSLLGAFYERQLYYNYEEFMEHFEATKACARENSNYKIKYRTTNSFKNIRLAVHDDKWVIVSKNNTPIVHFIIRHPGFRKLICNYCTDITEI